MSENITKKILKDYAKTKREIPLLEKELSNMNTSDAGLGSSVVFDYKKGYPQPQAVVGFDRERYERRAAMLENKKKRCAAVERFIEEIEDALTRAVFKKRYIDNLRWEQVAAEVGYGVNVDYVRKMVRDKYLKEKKIK